MKRLVTFLSILLLITAASACSRASASETASTPGEIRGTAGKGSYTNVEAKGLKQMLDHKNFTLVNVHVPYVGEIAQTDVFIPYNDVDQKMSQLPVDKSAMIVLYCSSGHMSSIAAEKLVGLGYTDVWNLQGGMGSWMNQGFSLIQR